MKKQQLFALLTLMIALFFVGNVMGQTTQSEPKPKEGKEGGTGNPNSCASGCEKYIDMHLKQSFDPSSPIIPTSIIILDIVNWQGEATIDTVENMTGSSLEDYYDIVSYNSGTASKELGNFTYCKTRITGVNLETGCNTYSYSTSREIRVISIYGNQTIVENSIFLNDPEPNDLIEYITLYPNPSNRALNHIDYYMPKFGFVNIELFDDTGNHVRSILNQIKPAGNHTEDFSMSQPGIYLCKITVSNAMTGELQQISKVFIRN